MNRIFLLTLVLWLPVGGAAFAWLIAGLSGPPEPPPDPTE